MGNSESNKSGSGKSRVMAALDARQAARRRSENEAGRSEEFSVVLVSSSSEDDERAESVEIQNSDSWASPLGSDTYVLELAKSGRTKCKVCFKKIFKHDLRVGIRSPKTPGQAYQSTNWYHPACFPVKVSEHQLRRDFEGGPAFAKAFMEAMGTKASASTHQPTGAGSCSGASSSRSKKRKATLDNLVTETLSSSGLILDDYDEVLLGTLKVPIVGIRFYSGVVHLGEWVNLVREPQNAYDRNAIRVDNQDNRQVGHIARQVALSLRPIMDKASEFADTRVECSIQNPPTGTYRITGTISIFGPPTAEKETLKLLERKLPGFRPRNQNVTKTVRRLDPVKTQKELDAMFEELDAHIMDETAAREIMKSLKPMKTSLMEHQQFGVAWMVKRERSEEEVLPPFWEEKVERGKKVFFNSITASSTNDRPATIRGGILADDMGLGKTIQTISTMVSSMSSIGKNRKRTLIVSPASVLTTWQQQIEMHVKDDFFSVCVYHGAGRETDVAVLKTYDIVLTTYGTLASEFDDKKKKSGKKKRKKSNAPNTLYQLSWHRVVLDEAHYIRNRNTKSFRAAAAIKSRVRWCLTGTPLQNKAEDLQSLFSFLRINPVRDFSVWKRAIGRKIVEGDKLGLARLRVLLKSVCLRRSKSIIANKMPERTIELHTLEMAQEQRSVYDALMDSAKAVFGAAMLGGGDNVFQNYSAVLELLLRLRQATCSTRLIKPERLQAAKDLLANMKDLNGTKLSKEEAKELFQKVQGVLSADDEEADHECAICFEDLTSSKKNLLRILRQCGHAFCNDCLEQIKKTNQSVHGHRCPLCRHPFGSTDVIDPKELKEIVDEREDDVFEEEEHDALDQVPIKIKALLQEMDAVKKSGEKALIFSNFTSFLDEVGFYLKSSGFKYARIDGSMTSKNRLLSVKKFTEERLDCMLVSIKAGGTGLNLTAANHVFIMDLWWNFASEEQAMDRCYRIGQTKKCRVVRYVCKDSVDERILEIQKRKIMLAKGSLQRFTPQEARETRLADLKSIFA
jgi:SWI/SNF-related matrix-associated actin-dependent regulator of chromatin subfamily A3